MTKKFFKATHKKTGEEIFFGLDDIGSIRWNYETDIRLACTAVHIDVGDIDQRNTKHQFLANWLKDYNLQYLHQGSYYDYE
jgi:hypothetical protein